ncbi:DUF1674 domain-containing protein [Rhodanobacter sp. B2A1Ga4]|uniref:DUF1674 domain-containing protein n=1 Tax=Rhodanobacter sp. B2A1Ga4 TaxID=2778647 RepID=UPI0031F2F646
MVCRHESARIGGRWHRAQVRSASRDFAGRVAWLYCIAASINLWRLTKTMSDTSSPAESTPASVSTETTAVPVRPVADKVSEEKPAPDPTRYGDWEKNGRCIDF